MVIVMLKHFSNARSALVTTVIPSMLLPADCASKGNFCFIDRVMSVYRMGAEGSTVDRTRKSKYKKGFYTKKIESLKLFNKESNFKFDLLVRNNIKRWEFVLCREEKNFKKMLSKEMSCFFAELPFHVKAYVLISSKIPVFDSFYYWLRKKIKGY